MGLQLTLPERSTRLIPDIETNPGKVEKWLASLPLLNVAEGGRNLLSTLIIYNRMDLPAETRLALFELYRAPVRHITLELQKRYVGLPLPLPDKHKSAAELHREFQLELAYGYKHVVLAHHQTPEGLRQSALDAALPLQRAIHHLTEVLLACYLSYAPTPSNLWRELHALYREAERLGIAETPIDDPLEGVHARTSISHAYKHALLLDLSDPYHLPSRMALKIHQYLEAYAGLATLHRNFERVEPNCNFLIDLDGDRAGILYSNDMAPAPSPRHHLLDTVALARQIHQQIKYAQSGQPIPCQYLPEEFYRAGGQEMLLRLINVWGINPKRTFRRSPRAGKQLDFLIGLDAVSYWLNGARRLRTSAERMGPFLSESLNAALGRRPPEPEPQDEYEYSAWDIRDDSAGGMSLRKQGLLRRRVKVGDLVAGRLGQEDRWTLSAVRWVKSPNPSTVEVGIQRLAPTGTPVLVKVFSDRGDESDFFPALLLPPIPALREPPTLLTPCNVYRPGRRIYLDNGTVLAHLTASDLLEATGGFERFAFLADIPLAP